MQSQIQDVLLLIQKPKAQEKVLFGTNWSNKCNYDNLCGDGTSGSGCNKGQPSGEVQKCCTGITDSMCGAPVSTGNCSKSGSVHYGWSYTSICQDAGQGVC